MFFLQKAHRPLRPCAAGAPKTSKRQVGALRRASVGRLVLPKENLVAARPPAAFVDALGEKKNWFCFSGEFLAVFRWFLKVFLRFYLRKP